MAFKSPSRSLLKLSLQLNIPKLSTRTQRALTTRVASKCTSRHPPTPLLSFTTSKVSVQTLFRRSYADAAIPKPKRKGRGFLRWTWRFTYLSVLGGFVYLGYTIYDSQTPTEQIQPDPSKKTLVILGSPTLPNLNCDNI